MIFECMKLNMDVKDEEFNLIYPEGLRNLATRHWTPIAIAKQAAEFLTDSPGANVLDIGSGAGKFCLIGAAYTKGHFTGVEYREYLCRLCNHITDCHHLHNVKFIHSNITKINFRKYNAFYFFNSFHENIDSSAAIDNSVALGLDLYTLYFQYVHEQLDEMPVGTRLATYWATLSQIPPTYKLLSTSFNGLLKMWVKTS